jgi:uncharacterized protein
VSASLSRRVLCLALLSLWCAGSLLPQLAEAQRYDLPDRPAGPVLDQAGLLSTSEESRLSQKLVAYEDTTSTAIVVVTLPSLDGAPIADYAVELGRAWGVGQGGKDNGAVVLISRDDRRMFIATGYGLEGSIPDAVASDIVRNTMRPLFRQGQFYAGISRATDQLMLAARGEFTATPAPSSGSRDDGAGNALPFIGFIILYFVLTGLRRGGKDDDGKRRRSGGPFIIWGGGGFSGGGGGGFGGGGGGFGGFGGGGFGGGGAGGSW